MKIKYIFAYLIIFLPILCFSQNLKSQDSKNIRKIVTYFKTNNREGLSNLITYPIEREYPLSPIKNKQEFIAKYSEIFDQSFVSKIGKSNVNKDWSEMGYRGLMYENGEIWIDSEGKIFAINYLSNDAKNIKTNLINAEKSKIHASISLFLQPICVLKTSKFIIRIDEISSGVFRYASWPKNKTMKDKPDLIIQNGIREYDGSGGNHKYVFKNLEYVYTCFFYVLSENGSESVFSILKNGKEILSEKALNIK